MNRDGVVIIIEDDADDQFLFEEVFKELNFPNKRIYFPDGQAALLYLNVSTEPTFLILSDINLPKLNGLELRLELKKNVDIQLKCVPYLYLTSAINHQHVIDAYCDSAQGFFIKPSEYQDIKNLLELILKYWTASTPVTIAA